MLAAGLSGHGCTVLKHGIDGGYPGTLKYAATPDSVVRRNKGIS